MCARSVKIESGSETFREAFWASPPPMPAGLRLFQQQTIVVPQVGRGGSAVYDLVSLQGTDRETPLVLVVRDGLLARDVSVLKQRLQAVIDDRRRREVDKGLVPRTVEIPGIATDIAQPKVVEACLREGVALIDQRGTVLVQTPQVFVHVIGQTPVVRAKPQVSFGGKAARILRILLETPDRPYPLRTLADAAEVSYVYTHEVMVQLEQEGWATRRTPRSGYYLRDAPGLLRKWMDEGERTAVAIESYNAPSTQPQRLAEAHVAIQRAGVRGIFTLASAIKPDELFVAGLPHGMYLSGDSEPVVKALGLRSITPYNFFILRAETAAETDRGGIYHAPRSLPHGEGVALPQLILDCQQFGSRGTDQARALFDRYAAHVPLLAGETHD